MACFNPRNQIEELISASNQTSTWSIKNMRSWLFIILMLGYESNRFQEGLITYLKISKISTYSNCSKKRVQMPGGGGNGRCWNYLWVWHGERRFHVVSLGSTSQAPAKIYPSNTLKTNICDSRVKHESISFPFGVIFEIFWSVFPKKGYPNSTQTKASQNNFKKKTEALTSVYWVGSPGRLFWATPNWNTILSESGG